MNTETPAEKHNREENERMNNYSAFKLYVTNEELVTKAPSWSQIFVWLILPTIVLGLVLHFGLHLIFWDWIYSIKH